jgi:hypothetical protein
MQSRAVRRYLQLANGFKRAAIVFAAPGVPNVKAGQSLGQGSAIFGVGLTSAIG